MPRAQKHNCKTRYSLEKLRLDVALKRSRLEVAQRTARKPIPLHEQPILPDARVDAVNAQIDRVNSNIRLRTAEKRLAERQAVLVRQRPVNGGGPS
jgi:hypothetical protein